MHAVLRSYSGNPELADALAARADEVRAAISDVPGVRGYYLIRTADGTVAVTVADDAAGTEASNATAASWLRENMPDLAVGPPQTSSGEVVINL
jgi:heme-degrading monooxygenase HmoA